MKYNKPSPKTTTSGCGHGGSKEGKTNKKGSLKKYCGGGGPKRRKH
jgi:hypothetical protein